MDEKDYGRLIELETKAKQRFIDNSEWDAVISRLDGDEQKEYYDLKEENNAL